MKKLVIAAAAVAMAMGVQAAQFKWTTSTAVGGVDKADVIGNGAYDADASVLLYGNNSNFKYELLMYTAGHGGEEDFLVGSKKGDVTLGSTGKAATNNINVDGTSSGVSYDYVLKLTVTQTDLAKKSPLSADGGTYYYDAATLAYTGTGNVTAKSSSVNIPETPGSWTVSGVRFETVPEPTSGLLLLLGVAGLALKRRRA